MTTTRKDIRLDAAPLGGRVRLRSDGGHAEGPAKRREFSILAYTGAVFDVGFGPAVFDLAGLEGPAQGLPVLRDHDWSKFLGRASKCEATDAGLVIDTTLFDDEDANRVVSLADQDAKWEASIGVGFDFDDIDWICEESSCEANGREYPGPVMLIRRAQLAEVSFVPSGADSNTRALSLSAQRDAVRADFVAELQGAKPQPNVQEVAVMADKPKAATAAELSDAWPDDPAFVVACLKRGDTIAEAKAARADVVAAELKAEREAFAKERAEFEAQLSAEREARAKAEEQAAKPEPGAQLSGATRGEAEAATYDDAFEAFQAEVDAEVAKLSAAGHSGSHGSVARLEATARRREAVARVADKNPALHRAMIAQMRAKAGGAR